MKEIDKTNQDDINETFFGHFRMIEGKVNIKERK